MSEIQAQHAAEAVRPAGQGLAERPVRVVFCWTRVSGYMAACWRAMAQAADVEPYVIAFAPEAEGERGSVAGAASAFEAEVMANVPCELLDAGGRANAEAIAAVVREREPDVVVVSGWAHGPYRRMVERSLLGGAAIVMAMDTPWRGEWRQRVARYRLRRFFKRIDRVMVTGERCWQYARRLGFAERQIHRGVYGIDEAALTAAWVRRGEEAERWPRRFLFVGRYAREKGVDVLLEAYRRYRQRYEEPFGLSCCGMGELGGAVGRAVEEAEGVRDLGFVQPGTLPGVFAEHGVFVLASRYDPWPLVIVEACAAGLPVICTSACGSAVELVRCEDNGWIVPTDDVEALAAAMGRAHERATALPTMGRRGRELAAAYGSEVWLRRWQRMLSEVVAGHRR